MTQTIKVLKRCFVKYFFDVQAIRTSTVLRKVGKVAKIWEILQNKPIHILPILSTMTKFATKWTLTISTPEVEKLCTPLLYLKVKNLSKAFNTPLTTPKKLLKDILAFYLILLQGCEHIRKTTAALIIDIWKQKSTKEKEKEEKVL